MAKPINILLQTTIPYIEDDWHITRFSLLRDYLAELKDQTGNKLFSVTARDRQPDEDGNDPVLANLDKSDFDQIWLLGVDCGDGITPQEGAAIARFRQQGKGILTARDHQDLGLSFDNLGDTCTEVKKSNFFHTQNPDPDPDRCCIDDIYATNITWPNYHSGANGDCQTIEVVEPVHPVLLNSDSPNGVVQLFPAHPHEGGVGVTEEGGNGRAIALGKSKITHRAFNLIVAIESCKDSDGNQVGRAIAESSFHHF
ncbi:MAG: hypothetical protein ACRC6M_17550, partial [Microcystaceae cyanobacterium]